MISYIWYKILTKLRGKAIKDSTISSDAKVEAGSVVIATEMGKFSYCGYDCLLSNVVIGSYCSISDNVIIGGGQHPLDWVSTSPAFYKGRDSISKRMAQLEYDFSDKKTEIGNDVWIGHGVHIKPGIKVGNGAVIGMGSVVTRDVEPYSVVAGCPAKEIKKRFDENTIDKLQQIKWWDFDEKKMSMYASCLNDVNVFIEKNRGEKQNVSDD